ncbi:unnamed protein product [Paramecium sonneborni]|uniref:Protein kinase domain-containing protein n=1 Tax=Paramecium sonneborni TaxID=65129 RepID=A0A8S1KLN2_9CILI|nr:unnamed protein product [Paramecium sonneborni]
MGNCSSDELSISELELYTPQLSQYKLLYVIGMGGYGRVWKVKCQKKFFALKEMIKSQQISQLYRVQNNCKIIYLECDE